MYCCRDLPRLNSPQGGSGTRLSFLHLPTELRLQILSYVVQEERPIALAVAIEPRVHDPACQCRSVTRFSLVQDYGFEKWPQLQLIPPSIALVCRQLHTEALRLFYKLNIFDIMVEKILCDLRQFKWLSQRPPELLKYVRCDVVFGSFRHEGPSLPTPEGPRVPHAYVYEMTRSNCEEKLEELVSESGLSVGHREWRRGKKSLLCTVCAVKETEWNGPHICRLTF